MSRSFLKTPILGNCVCHSEKKEKRLANRKHRRVNRVRVRVGAEPLAVRVVSNTWSWGKDGKRWFGWGYFDGLKKGRSK